MEEEKEENGYDCQVAQESESVIKDLYWRTDHVVTPCIKGYCSLRDNV